MDIQINLKMAQSKIMRTVLVLLCSTILTVGGCRRIRRAARSADDAAVAVRQQTQQLGERLTKAVDVLRVDISTTLNNLQDKMDNMTSYLIKELGPTLQESLTGIHMNVEALVYNVSKTLDKVDGVLDQVSRSLPLVDVLVLLLIAFLCLILLKRFVYDINILKYFVGFIMTSCIVTATTLVLAYLFSLFSNEGVEPTPRLLASIATALLLIIIAVQVIIPACLAILYYTLVLLRTLTSSPFVWIKDATYKQTWCRFLSEYLLLSAILTTVWLVAFYMFRDGIVIASLLTYVAWWCIAFSVRTLTPRKAPARQQRLRNDPLIKELRQKHLNYYDGLK